MRRKILVCLLLIGSLILVACSKKNDTMEFVGPVQLIQGEYYDVELAPSMHASSTPEKAAEKLKEKGKCEDAWINDAGHCVVRYGRDALIEEYYSALEVLERNIAQSKAKVTVNSDFTKIIYYISDNSTMEDWTGSFVVIGPSCPYLQLLSGVNYEDVDVTLVYEPTNTEMYAFSIKDNGNITNEEWENMMQEMERQMK